MNLRNTHPQERSPSCHGAKKIHLIDPCTADEGRKGNAGRKPIATETILHAILFRLREGCSWRALSILAPDSTIYTRWKKWCDLGIWDEIHVLLATRLKGKLWSIDSTSVKVHKHAFGGPQGSEEQKTGQSRGGANTKIHALADGAGRMLRVHGRSGNRHDLIGAFELVDGFSGRTILADKAYDSNEFREFLAECGLKGWIPPKANRIDPGPFHRGHDKHLRHVENFFQRIKEKRAISTRYEKLATQFSSCHHSFSL